MKKKLGVVLCMLALVVLSIGCRTLSHTVGKGAQGSTKVAEARQWYALWGLLPIMDKQDGGVLAGDATDYTIKTEMTPIDIAITFVAGCVTVTSETVTVTK